MASVNRLGLNGLQNISAISGLGLDDFNKTKSLEIKFLNSDKNIAVLNKIGSPGDGYNINFNIKSKNLINKNAFLILSNKSDTYNKRYKIKIESDNFKSSIYFDDFNPLILSSETYEIEIMCDDLMAKSSSFEILNSFLSKNNCFCYRDFNVDEFKKIVLDLRKKTYYNNQTIFSYHSDKLFHRNNETKSEYSSEIIADDDRTFEKLVFVLNKIFSEYEINNCLRKISFLSQMYIETAFFTSTIELSNSKLEYDPFRGRGFIQLTHEGNEDSRTKNATSYLGYKKHSKIDVISNPSIISKSLHYSADSAGWYWTKGVRKIDGSLINLNNICGIEDSDFKELTRLVKGSNKKELKERMDTFKELLKIMKYEKCNSNK